MPSNPFAERFADNTGINLLMADLASGTRNGEIMLGGGNPGFVPEVLERLRELLHQTTTESIKHLLGEYSEPLGDNGFRCAFAHLLNTTYDWNISEKNIALSNGSQAGFFALFNLLGGSNKQIILPLLPEYIGYNQLGLHAKLLCGVPGKTVITGDQEFIYTPDIEAIDLTNAAAVCVSSPCNPSGKVLTEDEITNLRSMCKQAGIPLIIDNAYGEPFPGIIFTETNLPWGEDIILGFSLSKFGLPAIRTGILVANEEIIEQIGRINAVTTLAPSATAARLLTPLFTSGEVIELSRTAIRPFYQQRAEAAAAQLREQLQGLPCYLHRIEGGLFIWLWMPDIPITSYQLYQHCKAKGVIIVPGQYFFPDGIQPIINHECIRISYAGDPATVSQGLTRIASEIRRAYQQKAAL